MNKFKEELQKLFPNTKIIKLGDITTKIATISKVRVGQTRTFSEYDEISLNDLDAYGVITVPEIPKYLGPANASSISSQRLCEGDLVLTHRGSVFKVGLVGSEYKKVIVGNNSMIRIQFPHARIKSPVAQKRERFSAQPTYLNSLYLSLMRRIKHLIFQISIMGESA
ncbi:MAG: hypothetical protein NTW78_01285 [Campylobacterales bacterium]|nr:hypothetical protein [Campylobacterales bacterium]